MAECAPLASAGNLDPSCDAKFKKAGLNARMYIGSLGDKPAFQRNSEGYITSLTLPTGKYLRRVVGRKLLNNASTSLTRTEGGVSFAGTVNFQAFFNTQKEKNTIQGFAKMEDLFIIVEENSGVFDVYGLVAENGASDGLEMTALDHNTGTAIGDKTSATLTFSGSNDIMSVYTKLGADTAAEATILDALVLPEAASQLATPTLTATATSSTQINLSWIDVVNEDSYLLEESTDGTAWTELATPAVGTTSYPRTGLTAGTLKFFRIKAVGNGTSYSDSDYSTASATTPA
ncbi:hypothetical protein GCM10023188_25710 [Pontibacter saemangeumensis]|uniref:Fibronectin type-III domain-containing protein n=1 Tax=Pontibacter saemangeumensis TaxID=1084525 RepID=A0ABP8LU99_9BACT